MELKRVGCSAEIRSENEQLVILARFSSFFVVLTFRALWNLGPARPLRPRGRKQIQHTRRSNAYILVLNYSIFGNMRIEASWFQLRFHFFHSLEQTGSITYSASDFMNEILSLTVPKGTTLPIMLDKEVKIRKVRQVAQDRISEPVCAFDKIVVPVGTESGAGSTKALSMNGYL